MTQTEHNATNIHHELINLQPNVPFKIYLSDQHPRSVNESYILPHYHADIEIIYLLKGTVNIYDDNNLTELHTGSVYIVNSNSIHSTSSSSSHITNYVLQISFDFLMNFIPDFPKYHFLINNDDTIVSKLKKDISLINQFHNKNNNDNSYLMSLSSLFDLMYILTNNFATQISSKTAQKTAKYHQRISTVIGYIESNYSSSLSLTDVANQIHLSPAYFSHFFKLQMGMTFYEYLTNVRMKHVESELKNTNNEILKIMDNCGFTTYHQFRKEFYQRFNMSPSHFRKSAIH
ncbi:AraC family transcriptional regulator [Lactiplantibacillus modestisalitolerans]|uniref:Helix-turn-helix domain-containing protein n=1 Tax=Lactiplantibacillus modestisalitolerans TaxID=1457219 RepID=A0ABV5WSW7_9LACO|nr:AraC family transcriptional regulator [Lactiplantibacillus modestisalitolerans]